MKSRTLTSITAMMLFAALAIPAGLAAQKQQPNNQQPRYRLIDLGTLGGPMSIVPGLEQVLNNRGMVSGDSDTAIPDPNYPNSNPYLGPDPLIQHAFEWHNGLLTDLGSLPGVNSSVMSWINSRGVISGGSENGVIDPLVGVPEVTAVLWKNGQIMNLGTLGGNESIAIAVNDQEQATGLAANTIPDPFSLFGLGTQQHAFLWQHGTMHDLGTLGGPDSFGQYVNGAGQIAGFSYTNSTPNPVTGIPTTDPFLWDHGTMTDLGTLGGTFGQINDINNRGQVVGTSNLFGDIFTHGFLWDGGVLTDVGTFGGDNGEADWVNEAGEIAGSADFPGDQIHHAFLWKKGVLTDLGTVGTDPCSRASAINSSGQIVGGSSDCSTFLHAYLRGTGGPMIDLNTLVRPGSGLTLTDATYISDRGEIAGNGIASNGDNHAFLLIPCGEGDRGCEDSPAGIAATIPSTATRGYSTARPGLTDRPSRMLDRIRARHLTGPLAPSLGGPAN